MSKPKVMSSEVAARARAAQSVLRRYGIQVDTAEQLRTLLGLPGQELAPGVVAFCEPRMGGGLARQAPGQAAAPVRIGRHDDQSEHDADQRADRGAEANASTQNQPDLRQVRVHTSPAAADVARQLGARAFTVGSHIVFGAGEYAPHNRAGRRLIAHELAHVFQPPSGDPRTTTLRRKPLNGATIVEPPQTTPASSPPTPDEAQSALDDAGDVGGVTDPMTADEPAAGAAGSPAADTVVGAPDPGADPGAVRDAGAADAPQTATEAPVEEPKSISDVGTGDLALIDEELAEHERWATVGAAGSMERADYLASQAESGAREAESKGLKSGLAMGAGVKVAETAAKPLLNLALTSGTRLLATKMPAELAARAMAPLAKAIPLPAIGAVIGGAFAVYDLAKRDWGATGDTLSRFGKGASLYDKLANRIEAYSTYLEVATSILNVIAGILGAISVGMWVLAAATAGALSPVAGLLSSIAIGIGIATMIIDGINALVLKKLVATFRTLHTFTTEADPQDVVVQGKAIENAAGAASGFVGNLAGAHVAGKVGSAVEGVFSPPKVNAAPPIPDHPNPPPATGDGPHVLAEPPATNSAVSTEAGTPVAPPGVVTPPGPGTSVRAPETGPPVGATDSTSPAPTADTATPVDRTATARSTEKGRMSQNQLADLAAKPELTSADIQKLADHHDVPPETVQSLLDQAEIAKSVQERRKMASAGGLVGPEFAELPGRQAKALRRGERMPGRSTVPRNVTASQRRIARERFGKEMQQALRDPGMHNERTQATEGYLTEKQKRYIRKTGELPTEIQFHHLLAIADFPEFGHLAEVGLGLPEDIHKQVGHAGDTTRPLEAGTYLDPGAESRPAFQIDPLTQKRARVKRADVASGAGSTGDVTADLAIQFRGELASLREQNTGQPSPRLQREISAREAFLKTLEPAPSEPPSVLVPEPTAPGTPSEASSKARIRIADSVVNETNQTAPASAGEPVEQPKFRVETPEQAAARQEQEAAAADQAQAEESAPVPRRLTLPIPTPGSKADKADLGSAGGSPVTETVRPNYAPPPASPQNIVTVQNEILDTLQQRTLTEAAAAAAAKQEAHHKANEKPLVTFKQGTQEAITATEAHKQTVARRSVANAEKAKKESEVQARVDDYKTRASGLNVITTPMKGLERFSGLAYKLPDWEDLKGPKRNLIKMNTDTRRFLSQLDAMDKAIADQKLKQTERDVGVKNDAKTIAGTGQKADASTTDLSGAAQKADEFDADNTIHRQTAAANKQLADQATVALDAHAVQKKDQAKSLAAQLQAWAHTHQEARRAALLETQQRLQNAGFQNVKAVER